MITGPSSLIHSHTSFLLQLLRHSHCTAPIFSRLFSILAQEKRLQLNCSMMIKNPIFQYLGDTPTILVPSTFLGSFSFLQNPLKNPCGESRESKCYRERRLVKRSGGIVVCRALLPVDPWSPSIDSQSIASQLFAFSLFPYLGFLYFITKSKSAPKLTLFGFYFLLAFVGATIPAGIYAKVHYGTSLSNVDWLHGGAESLLTLTNIFIVMGLREALRRAQNAK